MRFFHARQTAYHTNPKLIDEVIYTPYIYDPPTNSGDSRQTRFKPQPKTGDLLGVSELHSVEDSGSRTRKMKSKFDTTAAEAEIFLFNYGTVVIWGMTEAQEKRFLSSMYVFISGVTSSWLICIAKSAI
jgi:uncharacterized Rmd1/YagE family protein